VKERVILCGVVGLLGGIVVSVPHSALPWVLLALVAVPIIGALLAAYGFSRRPR
jgi:hypothetical protein